MLKYSNKISLQFHTLLINSVNSSHTNNYLLYTYLEIRNIKMQQDIQVEVNLFTYEKQN